MQYPPFGFYLCYLFIRSNPPDDRFFSPVPKIFGLLPKKTEACCLCLRLSKKLFTETLLVNYVGASIARPAGKSCVFADTAGEFVRFYRRAWCSAQRIKITMIASGNHTII
jgi:hypothetical protein